MTAPESGFERRDRLEAVSWLVGEGIDLRAVRGEVVARAPLSVRVAGGLAVVYRYGGVVLIDVPEPDAQAFLAFLAVDGQRSAAEGDAADLRLTRSGEGEGVDAEGVVALEQFDVERLRVVAEVLARSAILAFYEQRLGVVLADLEPRIQGLRERGRLGPGARKMLKSLGEVLATEVRMVARAEVAEKPEFVWDRVELDRIYARLAEEYELVDRDRALSRKLDLLSRVAGVFLEALTARRTLHVEWAIFALILAEIVLLFE